MVGTKVGMYNALQELKLFIDFSVNMNGLETTKIFQKAPSLENYVPKENFQNLCM
jgi:hypothetical protein